MKYSNRTKYLIYMFIFTVVFLMSGIDVKASQTQTIVISKDRQVADEFCNVKAYYVLQSSNTGPYCCAGYVKRFYAALYNVCVSQINTYAGPPAVAAVGANVSLRQVSVPQPGDIMQNTARTHVGIVKEVEGSQVTLIEQNWKWTLNGTVYAKINRKIGTGDAYFYRLVINGKDAAPATAAVEPKDRQVWQVSSGGGVNLRQSASASSASLLTIPYNTILNVTEEQNVNGSVWGKTDYNGKNGWILLSNAMYVWGQYPASDITPPVISDVSISRITRNSYTVTCRVNDDRGISRVQFPTWTEASGQDDLANDWWTNPAYSGTINGDTVTYVVKRSAHNSEFGIYNTHIYAMDTSGNWSAVVTDGVDLGTKKLKSGINVYIQNIRSGKYVTATGNYPTMKNFRNNASQLYKINKRSDGYYTITSVSENKRLSIVKNKTGNEIALKLVKATGKQEEYWKIYENSGKYVFRNKTGYEVVMIQGDSLKSNSKLRMNMQKDCKTNMFRLIY